MEYAQIARDILHIEPQDMFYFAKRLRSAGKLEKKEVWSRRPKAKKDKQDS